MRRDRSSTRTFVPVQIREDDHDDEAKGTRWSPNRAYRELFKEPIQYELLHKKPLQETQTLKMPQNGICSPTL